MTTTNIEWTDKTWNPVTGCSKVSPGCAHCYAEGVADRFWGKQYPAVWDSSVDNGLRRRQFTDVLTHVDRLDQPLRWKKPARVFVNSMSDLFHEDVPFEFIDQVFAVMALAPQHTFQVLTKRPERMRAYCSTLGRHHETDRVSLAAKQIRPQGPGFAWTLGGGGWHLPNVWLGVSVENQHFADERIPLLLQTPAAVRFISYEPALGPVDFKPWLTRNNAVREHGSTGKVVIRREPGVDLIIYGGESGRGARQNEVDWARSVNDQCRATMGGTSFFMKQLGAYVIDRNDAGFEGDTPRSWLMDTDSAEELANRCQGDPVRIILIDRKGGDMAEWPEDLRIREFPR